MRDLAFLAAWLILLPVALQGMQLAVLLWTWTSLLAPNDVLYGMGALVPFSKIAAIVTLGLMLVGRGRGIRMPRDATVPLMAALALVSVISQAWGLAADPTIGWELCEKYLKILLLAALVTMTMSDRMRLHAMLMAICLGIGFVSVAEGTKFLLSGTAHKVLGSPSTGDNNQIGLDTLLIMPMLYYLYATARQRLLQLVCIVVIGLCGLCVIATQSRAAFVGLAFLGFAFVLGSRRKVLGLVLLAILVLAGSQIVSNGWLERMNTIQNAEEDDSFLGRVGAWKESTAVALARPLFGGGFHAIQNADVWNAYWAEAAHVNILLDALPTRMPKAAHSIYFEILGDLGFGGLTLFLALLWRAWRNAVLVRRLVRRSGRSDLAWAASMAGTLQVSLTVFLIGGASLSAAYYDIDYLLVAMLAVLRNLVQSALHEPTTTPARGIPLTSMPRKIVVPMG